MAVELRNKVILSVDESDYAEYAFDCEYNVYNTSIHNLVLFVHYKIYGEFIKILAI